MNTYGFHTVHGRAPSIATGLKCARPDLTVWIITGDGDGLSIGGNHLIHCMRRNVDVNMVLVNNEIYGLTKGQYSPTSKMGKVAKSTPEGSIDYPINPLCIALAAEATFVARTVDSDPRHMGGVLAAAMKHKGASFVEIYQNCVIFNKDTHLPIVGREFRDDRAIYLEHGKPMIFGKNKDKGIKVSGTKLEIVDLAAHPEEAKNVAVHDAYSDSPAWAYLLTQMTYPDMPVPFGVFRSIEKPSYEKMMDDQVRRVVESKGPGNIEKLLYNEEVWKVTKKVTSSTGEKKFIDAESPEKNYWHTEEMQIFVDNKPDGSVIVPKDRLSKKIMNESVADFISKVPPIIVSPKAPIGEVLKKMQALPTKGCVLVCDDAKKLVGIVSIRDILLKVAGRMPEPWNAPIETIMTSKVEWLDKDAPLSFALNKMAIGKFRHVPVLDKGLPIGVVSTRDLIEYLSTERKK
jgi:2-oxoglutarate ferredoxin oxidoreductase subunit beta